jgi:hypothetical protein
MKSAETPNASGANKRANDSGRQSPRNCDSTVPEASVSKSVAKLRFRVATAFLSWPLLSSDLLGHFDAPAILSIEGQSHQGVGDASSATATENQRKRFGTCT